MIWNTLLPKDALCVTGSGSGAGAVFALAPTLADALGAEPVEVGAAFRSPPPAPRGRSPPRGAPNSREVDYRPGGGSDRRSPPPRSDNVPSVTGSTSNSAPPPVGGGSSSASGGGSRARAPIHIVIQRGVRQAR